MCSYVLDCRLKAANLMLEKVLITYALNIVLTSLILYKVQISHHREIVQKYNVCSTELAMSADAINDLCHIRENCNCAAFTSYELCQLIEYFCLR